MGWVLLMELYTLLEKMVSQDSLVSLWKPVWLAIFKKTVICYNLSQLY
jgi:hypothetical protein